MQAKRAQSTGTFRSRPALNLLVQLIERTRPQSAVNLAVLGCSKGAEVYSISYAVRGASFDLAVKIFGVDIEPDTLEFARAGVYSLGSRDDLLTQDRDSVVAGVLSGAELD